MATITVLFYLFFYFIFFFFFIYLFFYSTLEILIGLKMVSQTNKLAIRLIKAQEDGWMHHCPLLFGAKIGPNNVFSPLINIKTNTH